jgi:hypothetical protein
MMNIRVEHKRRFVGGFAEAKCGVSPRNGAPLHLCSVKTDGIKIQHDKTHAATAGEGVARYCHFVYLAFFSVGTYLHPITTF